MNNLYFFTAFVVVFVWRTLSAQVLPEQFRSLSSEQMLQPPRPELPKYDPYDPEFQRLALKKQAEMEAFVRKWNAEKATIEPYDYEAAKNNARRASRGPDRAGGGPPQPDGNPLPNEPEQNCNAAIPVCQNQYTQTQSYSGFGTIRDILPSTTCLGTGETNSVWYIFTVQNSGVFTFSLRSPPGQPQRDYDFALYDVTNITCADIPGTIPVRCNYSADYAETGMRAPAQAGNSSIPASGSPWSPALNVTAGQTFVLVVNNFTGDNTGYILTFGNGGGSPVASIFDQIPPTASLAPSSCDGSQVVVNFSEPIRCSSISPTDFYINGPPGANVVVNSVSVPECANGGTYANSATVNYTVNNFVPGSYSIGVQQGTDGNTLLDVCQNPMAPAVLGNFTLNVGAQITGADTVCIGQSVTLCGPPNAGPYSWSGGQTTQCITVTPTSTTTYTLNTGTAPCVSTATATVGVRLEPEVFVSPSNTSLCEGGSVDITAFSNVPAATIYWLPPVNSTNPTITVSQSGTFQVIAYTAGCTSDVKTATVAVNPPPPAASCNIYYVSPTGNGDGISPLSPTQIRTALEMSNCTPSVIKMQVGTYEIDDALPLGSLVTVEGGYNYDFSQKTSAKGTSGTWPNIGTHILRRQRPASPTTVGPFTFTNNTGQAIADNTTTNIPLQVNGVPTLPSPMTGYTMNVTVNVNHTRLDNLDVYLVAPNGTMVTLFQDIGGACNGTINITLANTGGAAGLAAQFCVGAQITGTYQPMEVFGSFLSLGGIDPNGLWQLRIVDDTPGNTGNFVSCSITFGQQNVSNGYLCDYGFLATYANSESPSVSAFDVFTGASNFRLQDLIIEVEPAPTGYRISNYGVRTGAGVNNFNIVRCHINVGKGSDAAQGAPGRNWDGTQSNSNTVSNASSVRAEAGGVGAAAGVDCTPATGGAGAASALGRPGGDGGMGGGCNCVTPPTVGQPGFGPGGGAGGGLPADQCRDSGGTPSGCDDPGPVYYGRDGLNGQDGTPGADGANGAVPNYFGGIFNPGGNGQTGQVGDHGWGGGGGGGGAGDQDLAEDRGAGGGGGGAGGRAAQQGGGGGISAGGSFALFVVDPGAGANVVDCILTTALAGGNPTGGFRGWGQLGGLGGNGGAWCDGGQGGRGGDGGQGGNSGQGGNGHPGVAIDYARVNSTAGSVTNVPYTDFNALLTQPVIRADNVACTNLDVPFYSGASGSWSFNPAQSSLVGNPGTNPIARFSNVAWYDVIRSGDTYSDFWGILTNPDAVTPSIEVIPGTTVCRGSTVTFNGLGSGGLYSWFIYQGLSSQGALIHNESGTSMSYTFTEPPGQYEVELEVVSSCCGPLPPVSVMITVVQAPNYTLQNFNECVGTPVTLTPSPALPPGATVTWQPGGFINNSITVSPEATTVYTLYVLSPEGCPSLPVTSTVTVRPRPNITGVTGPESICQGQSVTFTAQGGTPGSTYRWFRDGNLVFTSSSSASYTYTPFYNPPDTTDVIQVTASLNGCDGDMLTHYLLIAGIPNAVVDAADDPICLGESVTLVASGGKRFEWSTTPNFSANVFEGDSVVVTPTSVGTVTYYLRSYNLNCPCIPMPGTDYCAEISIPVVNAPQFDVPSDMTVCPGATVTLTAANTGAMPSVRRWETLTGTNLCSGGGNCVSVNVSPATTTTYVFYARSGNGCEFRREVTVNVGSPDIVATASANDVCPGAAVTLSATGGTTYTWSPAAHLSATTGANVTFTAPAAGTYNYTVTGTGAGGCTANAEVSVTVVDVPTISVTASVNPICPGQLSTMTANGAGPGATYSWSWPGGGPINGQQSVTDSPPATRTYTVTAVTASGCTSQTTFTLNVSPNPTLTVSAPPICVGATANFTANGAASYVWEGPHLNETSGQSVSAAPPAAGTYNYTVTGTSAAGCTGTRAFALTVNPLPTPTVSPVQTICAGQSANLTASGGTSYLWMPPNLAQQNITVSPNVSTVYTVTVQDANACTQEATTTVIVRQLPQISFDPPAPAICIGSSVEVSVAGAETYTVVPNVGASLIGNVFTFNPGATQTYVVTGTDNAGCQNTASITVAVNPLPTITVTPPSPAICPGGSVTLTANGAVGYVWNGGNLNNVSGASVAVSPDVPTTYTVVGTDANGCVNQTTVTVNINNLPNVTAGTSDDEVCVGETVTLAAANALTYVWNGTGLDNAPGFQQNVSPPVGTHTYTVVGTDVNGCQNTATVSFVVHPLPNITIDPLFQEICFGQSALLTASGAVSWAWTDDGMPLPQTTASVNLGLSLGNNVIVATGTDANGCVNTATANVMVYALPTLNVSPSPAVICLGQTTTLSVSGAQNYSWDGPAAAGLVSTDGASVNATPTAAGVHTFTVTGTDANGCVNTATVSVTVNPLPVVTFDPPAPVICRGQTVAVTAAGAQSFVWNGGGLNNAPGAVQTLAPLVTTVYTVTATDANGCQTTTELTLLVNQLPELFVNPSGQEICAGESATVEAYVFQPSANDVFVWNGPGINNFIGSTLVVSPIDDYNEYTVVVTDENGCQIDNTAVVVVNPLPVIAVSPANPALCLGQTTVQLSASGAATYEWFPSTGLSQDDIANPVANPAQTTTYTVVGTSATGCVNSATVTVTVNVPPTVVAALDRNTICVGQSAQLTASGAATYLWTGGAVDGLGGNVHTLSPPVGQHTYAVVGTDANGCTGQSTISLTVLALPMATLSPSATEICVGQSVTLELTGTDLATCVVTPGPVSGFNATFSPPVGTHTYTATFTDVMGCENTATATITVHPLPNPMVTPANPAICLGQSVELTASGGTNYVWNGGNLNNVSGASQTVSPNQTTTYTVTVTDANGCINTVQVTVTVNPLPVLTVTPQNEELCDGESLSLAAFGANAYVWNGEGLSNAAGQSHTLAPPVGTHTYTVVGRNNATGCESEGTVTITVHANPAPVVVPSGPTEFCAGGSVTLDAGADYVQYDWGTAGNTRTITVSTSGQYGVTVTDANGCVGSASIEVTVWPLPAPVILPLRPLEFCDGDSTILDAGPGYAQYLWSNSATERLVIVPISTTLSVTVTDANGCVATSAPVTTVRHPNPVPQISGPNSYCPGGTATLDAGAGFAQYQWTLDGVEIAGATTQTLTVSEPGEYGVRVSTAFGCTAVDVHAVDENPEVQLQISGPTAFCPGGSTTLDAGAGFVSYQWSSGENTRFITVTEAGSWTVEVEDAFGCTGISPPHTVNYHPVPAPTVTGPAGFCPGGSVTLNAGAVYVQYQWNDGNTNPTRTVDAEGFYFVTVTDANGCVGTSEPFFVDEYDTPSPVVQGPLTFCQGDGVTLFLPDSAEYTSIVWRVGATNVGTGGSRYFDETTSNITVQVVSVQGCPGVSTNVSVTEFDQLLPTISGPEAVCAGAHAVLTADGGYAVYEWFLNGTPVAGGNEQTLTVATAGDYTVRVEDAFGCEGTSAPFAFVVNALPNVTAQAAPICAGQTAVLTVSGAETYVWNGGNLDNVVGQTVSDAPVLTTEYTVTGTDANGCVNTATVTLTVNPLPVAGIDGATVFCTGQSAQLTALPDGMTYLWSTNEESRTITIVAGGDYSVTVTDANGCVNHFGVTVVQLDSLQPVVVGPSAFCSGLSAQLCVENPLNYSTFDWRLNGASIGAGACVGASMPGTYTVHVMNAAGCAGSATFNLTENALPNVVAQAAPICAGQTAVLTASGAETYVWNGGNLDNVVGQTVSDAPVFTTEYIVTGMDANECVNTATVTLVVNALPTFVVSGPMTVCEGQTGTITIDAANGATVTFCDGTSGNTFVYSQTTTCDFIVTSDAGCVSTGVLNLTVADTAQPVVLGTLAFCAGSSTILSLENAGNYSAVEWTTNETGPEITVDVPGVYGVRVHDGSGCWGRAEVAVVENPNPAPQILGASAICPGAAATLNAGAGFTGYQWFLNAGPIVGATGQSYTAGVPGEYSVTVTNANGCTGTATHTLAFHPLPDSTISGVLSFCTNNFTTLTAPSAPQGSTYEYLWGPDGQTTQSIVVTEGDRDFWVRVTDAATGCFSDDTVYVFQADTLEPQILGPNRFCIGGGVTLSLQGGYASYEWRRAGNPMVLSQTNALSVNAPGFYVVRVTDAAGCAGSDTITVYEVPNPAPQIVADGPTEFCEGASVTLTVGDGYSARRWYFNGNLVEGQTDASLTVDASGTYRVEVDSTDLACFGFDEVEVTVHPNPTPVVSGPAQICTGFTGVLTVDYPQSYDILWNTNETGTSIVVTQGGTYSVTVANPATGCVGTATFNVVQLDTLSPTVVGPYSFCAGQAATLSVVETFATYDWYRNDVLLNGENASTLIVNQAGEYRVRVTDVNGCAGSGTRTVVVNALPEPQIFVSTGDLLLCPGETATIAVVDTFASYLWNGVPGTHEFVVGAAGEYALTVASDSGCVATATISVAAAPVPSSQIVGPAQYCIGQTTTLSAAVSGMLYLWTPTLEETSSITVSEAGTHTLRVTDPVSGCYSETTVNVPAPADSLLPVIVGDASYCAGGFVELSVPDGPYAEYRWYVSGSSEAAGTGATLQATAGSYVVWVSNGQCSGTSEPFAVTELPLPDPQITGVFAVCPGSTFELSAVEGYDQYLWVLDGAEVGATASISTNVPGEYTLTVSLNGCSAVSVQTLGFYPLPDSTIAGPLQICAGESTTLSAPTGNYAYLWMLNGQVAGETQTLTVSQPGEAMLRVTDLATGCVSDSTVAVVQATELLPEIVGDFSVCEGASMVLDAGADYDTYVWTMGGEQIGSGRSVQFTRSAGTYVVRLEVTRGACSGFDEVEIVFTPAPTTAILGNLTICEGESTVLSLNSIPPSVVWRFNGADVSNESEITASEPGLYEVVVTDENGCSVTESVTVTKVSPPVLSASASTVCAGVATDLALTIDGVSEYSVGWVGEGGLSGTGTSLRHTYPGVGQYPFTVRVDYGACFVETTGAAVVVARPDEPLLIGDRVCAGTSARAFSLFAGPGEIYWYDRPTGGAPVYVGDTLSISFVADTATYWAERVIGGCVSDRASVGISVVAQPLAQFIADPPVGSVMYLPNATVKFTAEGYSFNAQRYHWDFGDSVYSDAINPTHTYTAVGEYRVLLYAFNENCVDTFSLAPFIVKVSDSLAVPNVFTPNGDGVNDVVKIFGIEDARTYEFAVYDRWGVYLFGAKNDNQHFWDGTFKGQPCPEGVYYYVLKAEMNSGAKHKFKGSITLIR